MTDSLNLIIIRCMIVIQMKKKFHYTSSSVWDSTDRLVNAISWYLEGSKTIIIFLRIHSLVDYFRAYSPRNQINQNTLIFGNINHLWWNETSEWHQTICETPRIPFHTSRTTDSISLILTYLLFLIFVWFQHQVNNVCEEKISSINSYPIEKSVDQLMHQYSALGTA